jgi:hypothetical protein
LPKECNTFSPKPLKLGATQQKYHMLLKPTLIATVQAVLSLSLASMGNCDFDLSWLDDLPAADDPKLHCGTAGCAYAFVNARVLIAEVLEWQGRHKEAIRCENINYSSLVQSGV